MKRKFWNRVCLVLFVVGLLADSFSMSALAAPEENVPQVYEQPDGTEIHFYASGDEFFHYCHEQDGTILIKNQDGYIVYATNDHGIPKATDVIKTPTSEAPANAMKQTQLNYEKNAQQSEIETPEAVTRNEVSDLVAGEEKTPGLQRELKRPSKELNGTMNNVVIYICFSDENPNTAFPNTTLNNNVNVYTKLKEYYQYASKEQLTIDSYVPKSGGTTFIYQDTQPRSAYQNIGSSAAKEFPLLQRALTEAKSHIPGSLNLDWDSDGRIDDLTFVVSGASEGWNNMLWPHQWSIYYQGNQVTINGAKSYKYQFTLQNHGGSTTLNLATMCHETGHILGAPDMYRYDYSGTPVGMWDLMASHSSTPQNSTNLTRYKYWGWMGDNQFQSISKSGTYRISLSNKTNYMNDSTTTYLIPTSKANEYIMIDYRKQEDQDEALSVGSGLMVSRWVDGISGNSAATNKSVYAPDELYVYNHTSALKKNDTIGKLSTETTVAYDRNVIHYTDGTNTGIKITVLTEPGENTLDFKVELPRTVTNPTTTPTTSGSPSVKVGQTVRVGKAIYKVTSVSTKTSGTVTYQKPASKKYKTAAVPTTIKIAGRTYKVTAVATSAFKSNKKLKSVTIGKNVKTIGANAFKSCSKLRTIKIPSKVLKKVGKNAIKGINKKAKLYTPKKKYKKYKNLFKKSTGFKKTMKIKKKYK